MSLFVAVTGCLKDKGFEDQKYGIQIVPGSRAVAFPKAPNSPVIIGITGRATPLTVSGPAITIEGDGPATSDVSVKLAFNDALVTAKGLTLLPTGSYSLSTTTAVIKSGKSFDSTLKITLNNSNTLDPTKTYGVGISMTSVDGGYSLAENSKNIVIGFTIKNKYDGIYRLQGYHNRTPYTFPYDVTIHMITQGANSVVFYWPEVKSNGHPIGTGVGLTSWYGDQFQPLVTFNTTTDAVTNVSNNIVGGTAMAVFTGTGAGVSRFDGTVNPAKMYVYWNYSGNPLRAFFDTLTYISPRP